MRYLSPALALVFLVSVPESDAQVKKRNGLFGFGRNQEQISAGLFPSGAPATAPNQSTPSVYQSPDRTNDGIFRGGEPSDIEAVSYVIEDGERVEKKVSEKRNFFAFARREKAEKTENALLSPVPDSNYTQASETTAPAPAAQPVADPVSEPRLMQDVPEEAIAKPVEEEKKSGGFFSFFSRKKDSESEPEEEAPLVANPVPAAEPVTTEPAEVAEAAEPEAESSESTMVEVPRDPEFADNSKPKKEKKDRDGILPPLPKIKIPKKPTNYENVETIIEDGEIVVESDSVTDAAVVTSGPDGNEPPKIVDGVKTYSSWDDVGTSSSSPAEQILKKIR